jgi:hypothetical protein
MKAFETATVVLVVSATLLDPWAGVLLASVFLLVQAVREVRRARHAHSKSAKRA